MLSKTGIRSLSKQDQNYLYKSNYWRGAVWINVNFLTLRGLFNNYLSVKDIPPPERSSGDKIEQHFDNAKALYDTIRHRLIDSIYRNWRINHLFWE